MSAPGSIELNQNILFTVENNAMEVLSNNYFYWSAIVFRNLFTLKERNNVA